MGYNLSVKQYLGLALLITNGNQSGFLFYLTLPRSLYNRGLGHELVTFKQAEDRELITNNPIDRNRLASLCCPNYKLAKTPHLQFYVELSRLAEKIESFYLRQYNPGGLKYDIFENCIGVISLTSSNRKDTSVKSLTHWFDMAKHITNLGIDRDVVKLANFESKEHYLELLATLKKDMLALSLKSEHKRVTEDFFNAMEQDV